MDSRPVAVQLPVAKTVYLPTSMDHCDNQEFDAVDRCSTTITDGKDGMPFWVMSPWPWLSPSAWGIYDADIWDPSKKSPVWFDPVEEKAWAHATAVREFRGVKAKVNFPPAEEEIGNPETKKKGNRNQSPSASNTAIPVESSSREGLEEELGMDPEDTGVISDWLRRYCGKGSEELGMDPENTSIISDLLRFVMEKEIYKKAGKAWKRLYLFYNPPGTDRSRLIAGMANYLEFGIYVLNPTDLLSWSELSMTNMLASIPNRSLIRIPAFDHRLRDFNTVELKGSCLLEFVHGLVSSCGDEQIIVFTTNNRDLHDAALQHPFNEYVYIHKSSPRPDEGEIVKEGDIVDEGEIVEEGEIVDGEIVDEGEIVQFDIIKPKPLVVVDLNFPPVEEKIRNPEIMKKGDCNQSPSASSTVTHVKSSSWKGFEELGMDPENTGIISDLLRFVLEKKLFKLFGKFLTRFFFLYDPPGADRSSLISAMADYLEYGIHNLDVTSFSSLSELRNMLASITNRSLIWIQDSDQCAGMFSDLNTTELTGSCLSEFVDGLLLSCGDERIIVFTTNNRDLHDAALRRPFNKDIYIHKSSPQPVALPAEGEIVLLNLFEQKPLVDFDATKSRAHQSSVFVSNPEKKNTREISKRRCMTESVRSLIDSTTRISSTDFDAPDNKAHLLRAHQSSSIVFNSEKKDTIEGLHGECLTKNVPSLDDSRKQESLLDFDATENKAHLFTAYQIDPVVSLSENKNRGEALKSNVQSLLGLEDLQQHCGDRRDAAAKTFDAIYDPVFHTPDSLAQKSFEVLETLPTEEQPIDCVPLLAQGRLPLEGCVQQEKSPDLPRVMQINGVEQRVTKMPRSLGGLTAQSASSSRRPIGLPDGGHIVLLDPLDQSTENIENVARADQCSPTVFLAEKKMVRKTLKRKCRTMSVIFEENHQHFGRRCAGAPKSFGAMRICRKYGINQASTLRWINKQHRIHQASSLRWINKQHRIHQWPFQQEWATRKGYSMGDERPFKVSRLYMEEKLDSGLQFIHMSQFARSSPRTLALPDRGEIVGPTALSSSEFAATNNRAHFVGQDQSSSTASLYERKNTRETSDKQGLTMSLCSVEDLKQHFGCYHKDAMKNLGVSASMFKSSCRQHWVYWWQCRSKNKAIYELGFHTPDSLAWKSFEVLETLPTEEQHIDCVPLLAQGRLLLEGCVQEEKSPDLPRVMQINGVEQRVTKMPRYLGGLTAQKWATRKGYSLGEESPFEVRRLSMDEKLDSRLQLIHMSHFARSSPRALALSDGGIVRPTALSSGGFAATNNRADLVGQDQSSSAASHYRCKNTREMSDKQGLEDLQQHFAFSGSMFKSTCRQQPQHWFHWWQGRLKNNDSLAWKSFKVQDNLPLGEQSNTWRRSLTHKHCVRLKKSQDLQRSMLRDCAGGLAAQSDIGLPDGLHIVSLSEKKIVRKTLKRKCRTMSVLGLEDHQQHVGRRWEDTVKFLGVKRICRQLVIHRETTAKRIRRQLGTRRWLFKQFAIGLPDGGHILSLPEKKIVRKTLKRKCRSISVLSLEDHKQHVDRRCEDAANSHGTKCIRRQLVIHRLSTAKRTHKQHGIHQWPFQRFAIGLPDGGHIQSLSEKKIVRKTLKRKCRSMSVLSLVDCQQHVDRRWEDAAKNIGAKRICRQLVIHRVSIAKRICRQHGIHHRWPFERDWATEKGYSSGDERPVEVICISTHAELVSRLQLIYISWLGRFSPWPSALPRGGLIVGPIALSSSEFAATNNLAQRVGQDQSRVGLVVGPIALSSSELAATNNLAQRVGQDQRGSGASGSENERTREQEDPRQDQRGSSASGSENERTRKQKDPKEKRTSITKDHLLQLPYRMTVEAAAAYFKVSKSTIKRKWGECNMGPWNKRVWKPPDQHGEGNTSTARETPSHNVQTGMEGEPVGQNQEANESRRDFMGCQIALNPESGLIMVSRPLDQHGERNTSTARETPSHNVQTGIEGVPVGQNQEANEFRLDFTEDSIPLNTENRLIIGSSFGWASQVNDQSTLSTPDPNHDDLVFSPPQITSLPSENRGGSIDLRNSVASQAEPFSDRHISGSRNLAFRTCSYQAAPSQHVEGQAMQSTDHNAFMFPQTQMVSQEPSSDRHISGFSNFATCSDQAAPSQHVGGQSMPTVYPDPNAFEFSNWNKDTNSVEEIIIKAFCGERTKRTVYRFRFPLTSGIDDLKKELSKRLNVEVDRFEVKYKDKYKHLISIPCDEDFMLYLSSSLGNDEIRVFVLDKVGGTPNFCERCRSSMQTRA